MAAGLVAVLCRSSTSLQHLDMWYSDSLGEQLVRGEADQHVTAIAQLTQVRMVSLAARAGCSWPTVCC